MIPWKVPWVAWLGPRIWGALFIVPLQMSFPHLSMRFLLFIFYTFVYACDCGSLLVVAVLVFLPLIVCYFISLFYLYYFTQCMMSSFLTSIHCTCLDQIRYLHYFCWSLKSSCDGGDIFQFSHFLQKLLQHIISCLLDWLLGSLQLLVLFIPLLMLLLFI